MNAKQLSKLGVPEFCFKSALSGIQHAAKAGVLRDLNIKKHVPTILATPDAFLADPHFGDFAKELVEERDYVPPPPIKYRTWGDDIDPGAHAQLQNACRVPVARAAALMPDSHIGYGVPIGAVLACENAVIPGAVGVDIACRMKLSILDMPTETITKKFELYRLALENGTRFGVGGEWEHRKNHEVMDEDWTVSRVTREKKDRAWSQLGTSGSGNHFVEFGLLNIGPDSGIGIDAGEYVALLSHSGSRGTGAAVCGLYDSKATLGLHKRHEDLRGLAWLGLDTEDGQEYWNAMNLMGRYAAANHDVIHKSVSRLLGAEIIGGVENHHNFAWKEVHNGKELVVHRKGATPAGEGVLGIIPGSMGSPGFVVRGKGDAESLHSASHGAGRAMSRTAARDKYTWNAVKQDLEKKGIIVLSAGADEVPYAYKDIFSVMAAQRDLVNIIGRFDPKIVKMSDDGKAED